MDSIPGLLLCADDSTGNGIEIGDFRVLEAHRHGRCKPVFHFEKVSVIAEGSFSILYKCKHKKDEKIVALKKYKFNEEAPLPSDLALFTSVIDEIRILNRLKHPNLVNLIEVASGKKIESLYLVLDYCEYNLDNLISIPTLLSPGVVKNIMKQMIDGLAYLHSHMFSHGNLCCKNILFDNLGILKIADFSNPAIEHEISSAENENCPVGIAEKSSSLQDNTYLCFKAPECLLGSKVQDPSIDIWSAGCIFGKLLFKVDLFPGETEYNVLEKIMINFSGLPSDSYMLGFFDSLKKNGMEIEKNPLPENDKLYFNDQSPECNSLLHGLLTFNPKNRLKAKHCLLHLYFKEGISACSLEDMIKVLAATSTKASETPIEPSVPA